MDAVVLANYSNRNKRRELDYYPTPPDVTHALMKFLISQGVLKSGDIVWEPACGDGAMSEVIALYRMKVISSDIRHTGYGFGGRNFLDPYMFPPDDLCAIITNPPFALSEDFIRTAIQFAPIVAMLLKSQYWHAAKRTPLFEEHPPAWILPLNWRPDFLFGERGGAPTMEVLWTVWIRGEDDTRYRILKKPIAQSELF